MLKIIKITAITLILGFTSFTFAVSQNPVRVVQHKTVSQKQDRIIIKTITTYKRTLQVEIAEMFESKSKFSIHPNPASDYIEISLGSHSVNKGLQPLVHGDEIAIYDVLGDKVLTVETRHALSLQRIDISHLPRGVYFVRVGERVEKFVKN